MSLFGRRGGPTSERRQGMRWVMGAWAFGAVWMYIVTGAALTQFAKRLDMPPLGFGLLAAMPFAGALVQLPVSYLTERYGFRKGFFIVTGLVHRGLWILAGLVPWVLPAGQAWAGFLAVFGVSWFVGQMGGPVWVSWMADLVPPRVRGRYFSRRSQLGQLLGMIVTIGAGYVLDLASGHQVMLRTIAVAFGVAGLYGMGDFLLFLPVAEMRRRVPNPKISLWELIREPLADRNFRRFVAYTVTLTFGTGFVGQFCWLYVLDVAGMSNLQANVMLVLVPLAIFILVYPVWGRLVDRFGRKPVLMIASTLIVPGSLPWIFVTHEHWVTGYLFVLVSTAAWPGIEIANFNLLLNFVDPQREGERRSSGYVAVNSLCVAVAGILSGLFGGYVAQQLNSWQGHIGGWPLTYHGVLFLIACGIRAVALVWLAGLEDVKARTTRAALRYLGTNLYSNIQQAIYMPGRLFMTRRHWTYRLTRTAGSPRIPGNQPKKKP